MPNAWAVRSFWRRLLCLLTGRGPVVSGHCLQCGRCCREIVLNTDGRWIRSPAQFHALLARHPDYERLEPRGRDADGRMLFTCSWLTPEGKCRCHEGRMALCRSHPSPTLWLRGVDLPRTCGYRLSGPELFGFLRRRGTAPTESFGAVLDRERTRVGSAAGPDPADGSGNGNIDGES